MLVRKSIVILLGCILELEDKILLLKTSYALVTKLGESS